MRKRTHGVPARQRDYKLDELVLEFGRYRETIGFAQRAGFSLANRVFPTGAIAILPNEPTGRPKRRACRRCYVRA